MFVKDKVGIRTFSDGILEITWVVALMLTYMWLTVFREFSCMPTLCHCIQCLKFQS